MEHAFQQSEHMTTVRVLSCEVHNGLLEYNSATH